MPCILKALIAWIILLVVSGAVGLFLRQALFGIFVPLPPSPRSLLLRRACVMCAAASNAGTSLTQFSASSSQPHIFGQLHTSGTSPWRSQLFSSLSSLLISTLRRQVGFTSSPR